MIGAVVASVGNNIVATVLTTFAINNSEYVPEFGLYLNLVIHLTFLLYANL